MDSKNIKEDLSVELELLLETYSKEDILDAIDAIAGYIEANNIN